MERSQDGAPSTTQVSQNTTDANFQLQKFGGSIVFRGNLEKDDLSKYVKASDAFIAEIMNILSEM